MADRWACICRFGGIGDNLMASSVLPLLAERGYKVEVMSQAPQHVVFENNPYIDKLSIKTEKDLPQTDAMAWQTWFKSRSGEYEVFANLSHSCESLLALLKGQTQFYWRPEFRRQLCGRSYLEVIHDIVGVSHRFDPRFFPTRDEVDKAYATKQRLGDKVIGWCLAGTRIDKLYPYSTMAIARLIREVKVPVVMFGAPGKEFELGKGVMEHVKRQNGTHAGLHLAMSANTDAMQWSANQPGEPLSLSKPEPTWPIRRVLTQAQACDLVIGPDTGPMWAVAMLDMPKLVLLSHASPENITKHWLNTTTLHADPARVGCWPCHQLHDDASTCTPNAENNGAACISDISVETIVERAYHLLHGG